MSRGRELVLEERLRQISVEHWTHSHDDAHAAGVLEQAGYCYLYLTHAIEAPDDVSGILWPWHPSWWKPSTDTVRNLVKAGALFCAEGERYERAGQTEERERLMEMAANVIVEIDKRLE